MLKSFALHSQFKNNYAIQESFLLYWFLSFNTPKAFYSTWIHTEQFYQNFWYLFWWSYLKTNYCSFLLIFLNSLDVMSNSNFFLLWKEFHFDLSIIFHVWRKNIFFLFWRICSSCLYCFHLFVFQANFWNLIRNSI